MTYGNYKVLHLTTHLNAGGVTRYISEVGSEMIKRGGEAAVLSSGGDWQNLLEEKGLRLFRFPIRTKNEFHPKLLWALAGTVRLVRREKFDLMHAHTRVTQVLASWVSWLTKIPFVSTAHGYYKPRFGRRLFGAWGARVIAVSPLVAEELEKSHKVPKSRIRVVYNGIDIEGHRRRILEKNPSAVRRDLGIGERTFVIGSVSRLVRDKGHEDLVEAAARLLRKKSDVFLLMIGDGREKERLEKKIRKLKLEGRARLLPSQTDITGFLSIMDVFVHPAVFREGFGLAMLEAMAAKIPVIASNIWAINSIIRHGVNGFLVEPKKPAELAEAIRFVMEHPENAGAVAQNAYQMACRLYSVERMADELETVYGEVVGADLCV
ncbi:MAG: glycosyltransferase family 4 protein [Candidatus Omnitrophica bacterium]|nr:glycosyltransferase family 4 protein [Candidatus Omnitrophota bacterium]